MTSDIIKGFNRDTGWLATGVLGAVVFAALVLAVQEYHPTKVDLTEEAVQAGSDRLQNVKVVRVGSIVAKSPNDKIPFGEGSGVDQVFNKTSPQVDPSSQTEPARTAPTPVFAFTPEKSPNVAVANNDLETSALRQDSARAIEPKARHVSNRSPVMFRYVGVKRRLVKLWHQSLATGANARSWTAFSNLNRGLKKKVLIPPKRTIDASGTLDALRKAQNKVQDPAKLRRLMADLIEKEKCLFRGALPSVLSLDDVLVETLIIGLPFGIVYGLKANGNGAMNSGGDMSSKIGSLGNQNL